MSVLVRALYNILICITMMSAGVLCDFPTCEAGLSHLRPINQRLNVAPLFCTTASNLRECAEDCVRMTRCFSVVFNRQTRWCEMYTESRSVLQDSDFENEDDSVFIDINEYKPACVADPCRDKPCGRKQKCYSNKQVAVCQDIEYPTCNKRLVTGPHGVADGMLNASSTLSNSRRWYIRLSTVNDGWQPATGGHRQWAQVRFYKENTVIGVITSGRPNKQFWVTSFKVLYSRDCATFVNVQHSNGTHKVFPGNWDAETELETFFDSPFRALCLRINPWTSKDRVGLRFDVVGCCGKIEGGVIV